MMEALARPQFRLYSSTELLIPRQFSRYVRGIDVRRERTFQRMTTLGFGSRTVQVAEDVIFEMVVGPVPDRVPHAEDGARLDVTEFMAAWQASGKPLQCAIRDESWYDLSPRAVEFERDILHQETSWVVLGQAVPLDPQKQAEPIRIRKSLIAARRTLDL